MMMEIKEALKEIKGGKYRPVYVLYGKDRYRVRQFVDALSEAMFGADGREVGTVKLDTSETTLDEAVMEAETPPFFVERKLLLIRDATVMAAAGKETTKLEHKPESLLRYMDNPMDSTVIVFVVQADKLDERRKLVKALKDRRSVIAFPELDAPDLKRWMVKRASDQRRTLTEEAADLLLQRAGVNMWQLSQEVDKLCLHVGEGGVIDREGTSLLTAATVEEDVFALVDAIAQLKLDRALGLYRDLIERKEEPIKITALIVRQIRIMLQIKELEGHHYSPQQMAGQLGLHPYAVKLAAEKGRKFSVGRLGELLSSLADLDFAMKSGQMDKRLGVELFLLSLGTDKPVRFVAKSFR